MAKEEYLIHRFSKKMLQKSVFPRLKDYVLWQQGKKDIEGDFVPVTINLDLTSACSNRCTHCIDKSVLNTGRFLDFEYIKNLLKVWKEKGLKSVIVIGGGEPTLHPNFEGVIEFIKKDLGLEVGIASNGNQIERIKNICHLLEKRDWVRLSLDSATNETFQKIHNPILKVSLEDILNKVKEMRQEHSDFQMGYSFLIIGSGKQVGGVPLINNIKEITLAAKLAKENGFSYLSLKPVITPEGSRETAISQEDLRQIKEEIEKSKVLEDDNFKVMESINLLCFYNEDLKKSMQREPKTCHMQFFRTVLNPEGIFSCSFWRGFDNIKIAEINKEVKENYLKSVSEGEKRVLKNLNAQEFCKDVHCFYAPFNCWVEDLINSPGKIDEIKAEEDFNDYFL